MFFNEIIIGVHKAREREHAVDIKMEPKLSSLRFGTTPSFSVCVTNPPTQSTTTELDPLGV